MEWGGQGRERDAVHVNKIEKEAIAVNSLAKEILLKAFPPHMPTYVCTYVCISDLKRNCCPA